MEKSTQYHLKVSLSLLALLGAIYFTFHQLTDGPPPPSESSENDTQNSRPEVAREESGPKATDPDRFEKGTRELAMVPKALDWNGYLSFNPFEGLDQPNTALYAISMETSPFFTDEIPRTGKDLKNGVPGAVQQLRLTGILTSSDRRLAVIDGRPYAIGEKLQDQMGNTIQDAEVGELEIIRIDLDRAVFKGAGRIFTVKLEPGINDFVKRLGENSPKSEEKKDE